MTAVELVLTAAERELLAECEVIITRGMGVFVDVGTALAKVRDSHLYRTEFPTFEDYCSDRFGLSRRRAYQMIDAANVVATILCTTVHTADGDDVAVPATERQARELADLLDDPDELREVWTEAVEATGGKPTAEAIKNIREARPGAAPSSSKPEPSDEEVEAAPTQAAADRAQRAAAKAALAAKNASEAALLKSIEDAEMRAHEYVTRFVHALGRALSVTTAFDAGRIADLVDEDQMLQLTVTVDALVRFTAEVKRRRSGLRLVGGTAS